MSLEELRKQVEEEEANEATLDVEETEEEASEAIAEDEGNPEGEPEESTDFELELDGEPEPDQQKPSAEEALVHKLTKQKKRAQKAENEVETLRQELEALKQSISQPRQQPQQSVAAEPVFPDMSDKGIEWDRKAYDAAVKKYFADMNAYQNRHAEAEQAQTDYKQRMEGYTKQLATRAAKFATDNRVSVDRVADALELATSEIDSHTNIDGSMAYFLDSVGDGSERVAYYIGTNEGARAQLKELLRQDPNGLKAIAHMTRLVEKLKPKHQKQLSKAPEPDEPVKGDKTNTSTAQQLQREYDAAEGFDKLMAIRKKAKALGVELK